MRVGVASEPEQSVTETTTYSISPGIPAIIILNEGEGGTENIGTDIRFVSDI